MIRQAVISGGVVYHHGLMEPDQLLSEFEVIDLRDLASTDLNQFDLLLVLRSTDNDQLRARRYQIQRYLDRGGVLISIGECWSNWFPGANWEPECPDDVIEPVVSSDHPIIAGCTPADLHWHPPLQSWCCHGHFIAPVDAEVLVTNQRGDAWLYIDRQTTNGVIVAMSSLDPDTHSYFSSPRAIGFFERLLTWSRTEAELTSERRSRTAPKIAGLFSGVHFQKNFYEDAEFSPQFSILPVWELGSTNLHDFAGIWIPRECNQNELMAHREKLRTYLEAGGTIVSFEMVNQPWLPAGSWELRRANMESIRIGDHPMVSHLGIDDVTWHSHGLFDEYIGATVLIDDSEGGVMLFLDETSFAGTLIAGTIDPDCHVGFGTQRTRPLVRSLVNWVLQPQSAMIAGA